MSSSLIFLRCIFLLSCITICLVVANIPNLVMSKSPSANSLKALKPSKESNSNSNKPVRNRERYDTSINDYLSERICGFNEMCKEEFSLKFKCRCPNWSFCSSPGRYYNAFCVMSASGYLWTQPQGFFNDPPPKKTPRFRKSKVHKPFKSDRGSAAMSLPNSLMSNNK